MLLKTVKYYLLYHPPKLLGEVKLAAFVTLKKHLKWGHYGKSY